MKKMKKEMHKIPYQDLDPNEEIKILAEWVKDTCLLFGASPATAYTVAGTFANGLEKSLREAKKGRQAQAGNGGCD